MRYTGFFATIAVAMFMASNAFAATCGDTYGDVNGDNAVNVVDTQAVVLEALSALMGSQPGVDAEACDLNCDDAVDVADVQLCIKLALGAPLSTNVDTNGNGCHDDCEPEGPVVFTNMMDGYDPLVTQDIVDACQTAMVFDENSFDGEEPWTMFDEVPWFEDLINEIPDVPQVGEDHPVLNYLSYVVPADVDGDGDTDLLVSAMRNTGPGQAGPDLWVLHNDNGAWQPPVQLWMMSPRAPIGGGDFDGDGHLDLIFSSGVALYVPGQGYPGSGYRYFSPSVSLSGWPHSATAFDVDNDGDQDILLASGAGGNRVIVNKLNETGGFGSPTNFELFSGSQNPTTYYFVLNPEDPNLPMTRENVVVCEHNDNWGSAQICYKWLEAGFWATKTPPSAENVSIIPQECDVLTIGMAERGLFGPIPIENRDGFADILLAQNQQIGDWPLFLGTYGTSNDAPFSDPMGVTTFSIGGTPCQMVSNVSTFNGNTVTCFDAGTDQWTLLDSLSPLAGFTTGGQRPFAWGSVLLPTGKRAPSLLVTYGQNYPNADGTAFSTGGCIDYPLGQWPTTAPPPCYHGQNTPGVFVLTRDGFDRRSMTLCAPSAVVHGLCEDRLDTTGLGDLEGQWGSATLARLELPGEDGPTTLVFIGGFGEPIRVRRVLQAPGTHVLWLKSYQVGSVIHITTDDGYTDTRVVGTDAQRTFGNMPGVLGISLGKSTGATVQVCRTDGTCTDSAFMEADTDAPHHLDLLP